MKTNENKLPKTNRNKPVKTNANIADVLLKVTWLLYCVAKFVVQSECNANTSLQFFFQTIHAGNAVSGRWFTYAECGKTIFRGTMDAGINNVIYMDLYSGPKMANGRCGKTIDTGTIDRGSTVYIFLSNFFVYTLCSLVICSFYQFYISM